MLPAGRAFLFGEKTLHHRQGQRRIFLLRHMPQLFEDDQAAARDIGLEALGIGRRNQAIAPTPENQRRLPHLTDQLLTGPRRRLLETRYQGLTITGPEGQLVIALDQLVGDPCRIAIDVLANNFFSSMERFLVVKSA